MADEAVAPVDEHEPIPVADPVDRDGGRRARAWRAARTRRARRGAPAGRRPGRRCGRVRRPQSVARTSGRATSCATEAASAADLPSGRPRARSCPTSRRPPRLDRDPAPGHPGQDRLRRLPLVLPRDVLEQREGRPVGVAPAHQHVRHEIRVASVDGGEHGTLVAEERRDVLAPHRSGRRRQPRDRGQVPRLDLHSGARPRTPGRSQLGIGPRHVGGRARPVVPRADGAGRRTPPRRRRSPSGSPRPSTRRRPSAGEVGALPPSGPARHPQDAKHGGIDAEPLARTRHHGLRRPATTARPPRTAGACRAHDRRRSRGPASRVAARAQAKVGR